MGLESPNTEGSGKKYDTTTNSSSNSSDDPPPKYDTTSPDSPNSDNPLQRQFIDLSLMKELNLAGNYNSLDEVTEALGCAGLGSSNLIVGVDFTASNQWTGKMSFNTRSLHHIGDDLNPYEQAISVIWKTLAAVAEDNQIPCFGFGDASTKDQDVFSFYSGERVCNGLEDVLSQYREIVPKLTLAGPTSFAPIIEMAMTIVKRSGNQYHILLIIANGQVTRSDDTEHGQLSPQELKTVEAIAEASKLPLSIILVGVGDGPWDKMREFDDNIPTRFFDNFHFVNFTEIMSKNENPSQKETAFALAALREIPSQYKGIALSFDRRVRNGNVLERVPLPPPDLPPPVYVGASFSSQPSPNLVCPICLANSISLAFGCGHLTCYDCGQDLQLCPFCRQPIQTRVKIYI